MRRAGYLQRADCRIYYEVAGRGPALIFAHGLGGNHLSWWQQIAQFAAGHTCVVFAHRGFPPSGAAAGEAAPGAFADDLAALIDTLELEEVSLVAQSMGGWTCLEYALREPGKVRALVMASTSGAIDFNRLAGQGAAEIQEWLRRSSAVMSDLGARDIHPASGERMEREQPALAALAPKGRAVRLPEAGHSVYFERAAQFNRIVGEFLTTP